MSVEPNKFARRIDQAVQNFIRVCLVRRCENHNFEPQLLTVCEALKSKGTNSHAHIQTLGAKRDLYFVIAGLSRVHEGFVEIKNYNASVSL